mmetsp:Transcript_86543/g.277840  ORF Transcript_86543/g.277840 Transcript_86543/m.277840 type:complete len:100 (-) Transcript_86543:114-413(-)
MVPMVSVVSIESIESMGTHGFHGYPWIPRVPHGIHWWGESGHLVYCFCFSHFKKVVVPTNEDPSKQEARKNASKIKEYRKDLEGKDGEHRDCPYMLADA